VTKKYIIVTSFSANFPFHYVST